MPENWVRGVSPGRSGRVRLSLMGAFALFSAVMAAGFAFYLTSAKEVLARPTAFVRRLDFDALVLAAGRVESANVTEINCKLQKLGTGTAPTILSLVEDGTNVREGEVLCEIDSTSYQELVRRQAITVGEAQATFQQAQLDLEVARIGLDAYLLGELRQTDQMYQGQIALAKSDLVQRDNRLIWTRRMVTKGYFSVMQVATEELALSRAKLSLSQIEQAKANYQRFSAPMTQRSLESQINGSQATFDFQSIKLKREEERLALYKKQVDYCTVLAPHDGFLIHANRQGRSAEVFEGATVRERQKLFTLPDLSKMVVQAYLHETVVNRVKVGMPVTIRLEAVPGRSYEGTVLSIAPLPYNEKKSDSGTDVTYFIGQVGLESVTQGLRPGMTAELEIITAKRRGVVAIPYEAIFARDGHDSCYVVHGVNLERRQVVLGDSSHDLREVVEGLREGEEVVLLPRNEVGLLPISWSMDNGNQWCGCSVCGTSCG